MANEVIIRDNLNAVAVDFTVADGTGVEKGAILKLTDPRTAIITSAAGDKLAGIAAREKVASDGRTRLSVYRNNLIVDAVASGAITVGDAVISAGAPANQVKKASAADSGCAILGYALETATDQEVIQVMVHVGGNN